MKKLRWGALGVALLSVGLLATPAAAEETRTVVRDRNVFATLTDCPANAAVGTRCAAWLVFAAKTRVKSDGTVDTFGYLSLEKFRIKIVQGGFEATSAGFGDGAPTTLKVEDNLSRATMTGKVLVTYFEGNCLDTGTCRTKWIPISLRLQANSPATNGAAPVESLDGCTVIQRFESLTRSAEGSAKVNGIPFVTTEAGGFGSSISKSKYVEITRGDCGPAPTMVAA